MEHLNDNETSSGSFWTWLIIIGALIGLAFYYREPIAAKLDDWRSAKTGVFRLFSGPVTQSSATPSPIASATPMPTPTLAASASPSGTPLPSIADLTIPGTNPDLPNAGPEDAIYLVAGIAGVSGLSVWSRSRVRRSREKIRKIDIL